MKQGDWVISQTETEVLLNSVKTNIQLNTGESY